VKILIVSATKQELDLLSQQFNNQVIINDNLTSYNYKKLNIHILITGVSYVSLMYFLTLTLEKFKFDIVINAGIAGSYNKSFEKGTVINVRSEVFSDFLIEDNENLFTLFEKGLIGINDIPFQNGKLFNDTKYDNHIINNLDKADAITSNTIHGNIDSIEQVNKLFHPDIETMEGAGFFYICLMKKVPFIQIRCISNMVEPLNKTNWEIRSAIRILNDKLKEILEVENLKCKSDE
jgi:futalosine hydrolase